MVQQISTRKEWIKIHQILFTAVQNVSPVREIRLMLTLWNRSSRGRAKLCIARLGQRCGPAARHHGKFAHYKVQ